MCQTHKDMLDHKAKSPRFVYLQDVVVYAEGLQASLFSEATLLAEYCAGCNRLKFWGRFLWGA